MQARQRCGSGQDLAIALHARANIFPGVIDSEQRLAAFLPILHAADWVAEPRATFKIVVGDPPDLEDALRLAKHHALPRERVMLMPEGLTDATLRERAATLAEACKREGLRLSPRLHVWMWGARRGV